MNTPDLNGKKIAIITENGFEEIELTSPKKALEEAGATVHIISMQQTVKAWDTDHWSISFAAEFLETGKPVAAICHGPQLLIETGMIKGKDMTSYASLKTDLVNAGVNWLDEEVVTDNGLVTSRSPKDLPAFNKKIIEEFAEGIHKVRNPVVPMIIL